jgi:hypothetical protein
MMATLAAPAPSQAPLWFSAAAGAMQHLCSSYGPPLDRRLGQLAARLTRMHGAGSLEEGLCSPVATPAVALVEALRADYCIAAGDPRLAAIGEAALALYLYLRVQDDIVDEPALSDRASVYVAALFCHASQRAFARALPDAARFFAFQEEVMTAFAAAATWEIDVVRAGAPGEGDLTRIGQKLLPVAIPLGAVALLAGRPAHLPLLIQFTTSLGTGLQMINDILNIKEDHAGRRPTLVLRWLYAEGTVGPQDSAAQIRMALMASAALTHALEAAQAALDGAERSARALPSPRLAAVAGERLDYLTTVPTRLLRLYLTGTPHER